MSLLPSSIQDPVVQPPEPCADHDELAAPTTPPMTTDPAPGATQRRRYRWPMRVVVAVSMFVGLAAAIAGVVVSRGGTEPVVDALVLLGFAAGWALLLALSEFFTDHPQRWAAVPAAVLGVGGAALLVLSPSSATLDALGWVWPPALLGLLVWITTRIHRQLPHCGGRWLLYPVVAVTAAAAVGGSVHTVSQSIDQASSISDVVDPFDYKRMRGLSAWDLTHNLVATYSYQFPLERLTSRMKPLTRGWQISGITRISSGFPVTISRDVDTSLQGSSPNGVNNHLMDLPDYTPGTLNINGNPRNGLPYFNTDLFTDAALGTPGSASRRTIHGPGMLNFDISLMKSFKISETKNLQFRWETFNSFNHAQFFGPSAVNGDFDSGLFGQVVKAAPPRLMQLALKFTF